MKKVCIIGSCGVPANYGGFETLVEMLTAFKPRNMDVTIFCSEPHYKEKLESFNGCRLKYIGLNANGMQSVFYDIISMCKSLFISDAMLILGVSGCVALPIIKLFYRGSLVVNVDGIESRRAKWNWLARTFLKVSEFIAVKFAHVVISDNEGIRKYIIDCYGVDSHVIAYGGDHTSKRQLTDGVLSTYPFLAKKYYFKVARIEPENNIEMILAAFSKIPSATIAIVGNWNASEFGTQMFKKYGALPNIKLINPIYDLKILDQIRSNAFCYIHGHSAGGTNPSLVEAMSLGLPILAFDVCFNRYTTENLASYFKDESELISLVSSIDGLDCIPMESQLVDLANSKFTWKKISEDYYSILERSPLEKSCN